MNGKIIDLLNLAVTTTLDNFHLKFEEDIIDLTVPNPEKLILRKNEAFNMCLFFNKKFEKKEYTII